RARFSRAGRTVLGAAAVAAEPLDYLQRRRAAAAYNQQFPTSVMSDATGYTFLPPGALPGTPAVIESCRRLFEGKQAELEALMPTGKKAAKDKHRKRSFLRDLLTHDDLLAHPGLV